MYIIVEGMPSSGKSTLAKNIATKFDMVYFKSLLPSDDFGNKVRYLRDNYDGDTEVNLLHIIDLMRNELQIKKILDSGHSVVRDKSFVSSLAHYLSVQSTIHPELRDVILSSYYEILDNMIVPDYVFFIDRSYDDSINFCKRKDDKSIIDSVILDDHSRFVTQHDYLFGNVERFFGDKLYVFNKNETVKKEIEIVQSIILKGNDEK